MFMMPNVSALVLIEFIILGEAVRIVLNHPHRNLRGGPYVD